MISKKISRKAENDNYRLLALYAGAANHEGEKLLLRWHAGCISDEYDMAMREVEAVQALNTRTTCAKTYHLMVSIHPEDEIKLTPAIWLEIEKAFSKALGYAEHQRHCGVHKNTNNMHMHIAYNMIHPQTYNRHDPFRDYFKRDAVCREMEKQFGLRIDVADQAQDSVLGHDHDVSPKRGNDKAHTVEAHTGQQSFDTYVLERKKELLAGIEKAQDWQAVHALFAEYGLEIKLSGAGGAIKDRHGKHAIKASALDRACSKANLEKRFGVFSPSEHLHVSEKERFSAQPLHSGAERGQLFKEFEAGIERRKTELAAIADELAQREEKIKKRWSAERLKAEQNFVLRTCDRIPLLRKFTAYEREELKKARADADAKRQALREAVPYCHWSGFLQAKARGGNEMALAILRSKGEEVTPEKQLSEAESIAIAQKKAIQAVRERRWDERTEIYSKQHLLHHHVLGLQAVSFMNQLIEEEEIKTGTKSSLRGFTWDVDTNGIVLFRLPTGGLIRDSGKQVGFSAFDPAARETAEKLAQVKFGKACHLEGNTIVRDKKQERSVER